MRDVKKEARLGMETISNRRDMVASEINQLFHIAEENGVSLSGIYDVINTAFYFGFSVGMRQAKSK